MKKGFSLIEVIAAIAIFSIGILAITLAFSTSLNVSQMNDVKQNTSQYAQAIMEKSKNIIESGNNPDNLSKTFYFYNLSDIDNCLQSIFTGSDDKLYFNQNGIVNGNKFQFKASININKEDVGEFDYYNINVHVQRIGQGTQDESVRDMSVRGNIHE